MMHKLLEIHADRAWRRFDKMVERQMKPVESLFRGYFRSELPVVLSAVGSLSVDKVAAALMNWEPRSEDLTDILAAGIKTTEKKVQTALENNGKRWSKRIEGVLGKAAIHFAVDTAYALSFKFPGFPRATLAFIRSYVPKIVDQLADSTRHRIMKTISRGIEGGLTLPEIEADIRQVYKSWDRSRPEVIARTETGRIASVTQNDVIAEAGLDVIQIWLSARDDRVRDSHNDEGGLDGEEREMGEEFSPGLKFPRDPDGPPEETINCFLGDARIEGLCSAAIRSEYAGPIRHVTTRKGRRISVTPNHPILTAQGFIAAGLLQEGNYLVANSKQSDRGFLIAGKLDQQQQPPRIADIFEALNRYGSSIKARVSRNYFNGDAEFFANQIDVVSAKSELLVDRKSFLSQQGRNIVLEEAAPASLPSSKHLILNSGGLLLDALPLDCLGFGLTTQWDALLFECAVDGWPTNPDSFRDLVNRLSVVIAEDQVIEKQRLWFPDRKPILKSANFFESSQPHSSFNKFASESLMLETKLPSYLRNTFARMIEFDEVIEVRDDLFHGFVYDVETTTGLIVNEDLIFSNCRCSRLLKLNKK